MYRERITDLAQDTYEIHTRHTVSYRPKYMYPVSPGDTSAIRRDTCILTQYIHDTMYPALAGWDTYRVLRYICDTTYPALGG